MITGDQAIEALRLANPATDERHLPDQAWTTSAVLEDTARRMAMKTHDTKLAKLEPRRPRRPRGLLVAVAGFAVALVLVGVGVMAFSGSRDEGEPADPPETTAAPTTTLARLSEVEAREIVDSAFAAFNSGDMDTWVLWREGTKGRVIFYDYEPAAGARLDVEQCTYRGFQEWMMDEFMLGHGFDCAVTYTDRLLGAAGIELQETYNWVIGVDPESSLGGSNGDGGVVDEFLGAYRDWLSASHPEVAATMQYGFLPFGGNTPAAQSVPTALEYVDEFVAQSDVYPLTEPVPPVEFGGPLTGR